MTNIVNINFKQFIEKLFLNYLYINISIFSNPQPPSMPLKFEIKSYFFFSFTRSPFISMLKIKNLFFFFLSNIQYTIYLVNILYIEISNSRLLNINMTLF